MRGKYDDDLGYDESDGDQQQKMFLADEHLTFVDWLVAASLAVLVFIGVTVFALPGLSPVAWDSTAVAAGLRPPVDVFPGFWRSIAHLAVLVAPVAVVHIVTHQVIDLLRAGVLSAPLAGSREGYERKLVLVAEFLLHACIECEIAVEHALDPIVPAHADRSVEGIGPPVVELAAGIVCHEAEAVERGIAEHAETPAGAYAGGNCKDVGHAVELAHTKV